MVSLWDSYVVSIIQYNTVSLVEKVHYYAIGLAFYWLVLSSVQQVSIGNRGYIQVD